MRAVRNNPNRAHNYFQDFSKCLSIFNKALKLQKNRKRKQTGKRGRESLPSATQQAHLPAQPSHRSSELLGLARQAGSCSTASTACVPRSCPPPRRSPRRAVDVGRTPSLSPTSQTLALPSGSSLSPSPTSPETSPSPPLAAATSNAVPAPSHRVRTVRRRRLRRLAKPHDAGAPASSPPPSSSTSGRPDRRRCSDRTEPSPSMLTIPAVSL